MRRRFRPVPAFLAAAALLGAAAAGAQGVTLYEGDDFHGRSETFYGDDPRLDDNRIGNDRASSVEVPRGCEATLYEHADYRGRSIVLTRDAWALRGTALGDDAVSSLRVDCRGGPSSAPPPPVFVPVEPEGPGAAGWSGRPAVILYREDDFRGVGETFELDDPNLRDNAIGNDAASSLRVAPGCEATLYEHADYGGHSLTLSEDLRTLRGSRLGNDAVSSLRVSCRRPGTGPGWTGERGSVTLFRDAEFRGASEVLYGDDPNLGDNRIGNDELSSLRVAPGCEVTLYEHADYRGRSATLTEDAWTLLGSGIGNDQVSSLRLSCRGGARVTLYRDDNYRGTGEGFYEGRSSLRSTEIGNDQVSSLRVEPGCRVILYEHDGYRGRSMVVDRDLPTLRGTPVGNDQVSSFEVDCGRR